MSTPEANLPDGEGFCGKSLKLTPKPRSIGAFDVLRVLPARECQMVGPFIFFDHFGPVELPAGEGINVRPHPHIGLATLTYLYEGEIFHRDSLGNALAIRPGEVNWMTAGRGIVHSERERDEVKDKPHRLHGIQSWIALPVEREEEAPAFYHHGTAELPLIERDGAKFRLIIGKAFGAVSPVKTFSDMFYVGVEAEAGARFTMPAYPERALYVAAGAVEIDGAPVGLHEMQILGTEAAGEVSVKAGALLMLLGGASIGGRRHIWWNFVSSSKERIAQAAADWRAGQFPKVPGDEKEFIPVPDLPAGLNWR